MNNDYFNLMVTGSKLDKLGKGRDQNLELSHSITNMYGDDYQRKTSINNGLTPMNYMSRLMDNPGLYKQQSSDFK